MSSNFWEILKARREAEGEPIFALAPMADVTDAAFRSIIAKYSKPDGPDVMFTEFVSADGLDSPGKGVLVKDLAFGESERPIVAQFFTGKPEKMEKAARLAVELGFDGVDVNMGCPDRGVEKQVAGAALIKNPALARELIRAAKKGIKSAGGNLPVSVKTRIGYNRNEIETWLPELLHEKLAAIILHARTRKEMSSVPADWDVIKRAVQIRDGMKSKTLIVGNGDVLGLNDAREKAQETGADGIMLGRAVFGTPWLFANLACVKHNCQIEHPAPILPQGRQPNAKNYIHTRQTRAAQSRNRPNEVSAPQMAHFAKLGLGHTPLPSTEKILAVMVEHTKLFEEFVSHKNFAVMKKHYKAYVNGFPGAQDLRVKLMEANSAEEVEKIVSHFLKYHND